jgi:hypothetical protein
MKWWYWLIGLGAYVVFFKGKSVLEQRAAAEYSAGETISSAQAGRDSAIAAQNAGHIEPALINAWGGVDTDKKNFVRADWAQYPGWYRTGDGGWFHPDTGAFYSPGSSPPAVGLSAYESGAAQRPEFDLTQTINSVYDPEADAMGYYNVT